jgi:hypothetical protein
MPTTTDVAHLHDAFRLGSTLVELKSRIAIAARQPSEALGPTIRLSSVWRSGFGQLAALLKTAFPKATTTGGIYEPPGKDQLPYLYPEEPDYANVGIKGQDEAGSLILENFELFDVTRRAINCLTVLYVNKDESLIPDRIEKAQQRLIAKILSAPAEQGEGAALPPLPGDAAPTDRLQRAKQTLTARTLKFLDAWEGYIRENYYAGGARPNDELELIAYEAGFEMASMSWDVSIRTLNASPEQLEQAWRDAFWPQDVIRLQYQISALSSVLDEAYFNAYYEQHPGERRGQNDAAVVAAAPSLAIQAVKQSLMFWQRTVDRECRLSDQWGRGDNGRQRSEDLRRALIKQGNIWLTLISGQQSLSAFTVETVTRKIMSDVSKRLSELARTDLPKTLEGVRATTRAIVSQVADQTKDAIDEVRHTAVRQWDAINKALGPAVWVIVAVIAILGVGAVVALAMGATQVSAPALGSMLAAGVTAISGWFGLQSAKDNAKAQIDKTSAEQKSKVESATEHTQSQLMDSVRSLGAGLLTRVEGAAHEAASEVLAAFERAYGQVREELKDLGHSVAISYPLLEYYGANARGGDDKFVTQVLWPEEDRQQQVERIARAALGPLAMLIAPEAE